MPIERPQPGDVLMMVFPKEPNEKLPPYYLFSADTGDVVAGPFSRVANALKAARLMARKRGGRVWHKRREQDENGHTTTVLHPIV